jgi:hypothetical protein
MHKIQAPLFGASLVLADFTDIFVGTSPASH